MFVRQGGAPVLPSFIKLINTEEFSIANEALLTGARRDWDARVYAFGIEGLEAHSSFLLYYHFNWYLASMRSQLKYWRCIRRSFYTTTFIGILMSMRSKLKYWRRIRRSFYNTTLIGILTSLPTRASRVECQILFL